MDLSEEEKCGKIHVISKIHEQIWKANF